MIKVIQLAKDWYQVQFGPTLYVGDLATIRDTFINHGYKYSLDAEVVPLAGIEGVEYENKLPSDLNKFCIHNWVEYEGIYKRYYYCSICDMKNES